MPPRRAADRAPRRGLGTGRKLLFSALTTACALLALELGARLVDLQGPRWRQHQGVDLMVSHPTRLWAMAPGAHRSGALLAQVGEAGLRGPALPAPAAGDAPRVLVLGDSSFFGHGVREAETLPAQLEQALRARGVDARVQNFGVPGYSSIQSRALLDEQGWAADPDLVLIGSLWSDNNIDGFRDADLLATRRLLDQSRLSGLRSFLLLTTLVSSLRGERGARVVSWTSSSAFPSEGQRRVPLPDYAAQLDGMARDAAARGVGVAFLAPANQDMLGTGADAGGVAPVWGAYFEAQAAVAAHHGVPLVPLAPALAASGSDPAALFVDVMHPSAEGHRLAAEAVAEALVAAGWPAARLRAQGPAFDPATLPPDPFVGAPLPAGHRSPQLQLFGGTGAPDADLPRPQPGADAQGRR
jgi:lysophospholipase L1-like esterase